MVWFGFVMVVVVVVVVVGVVVEEEGLGVAMRCEFNENI